MRAEPCIRTLSLDMRAELVEVRQCALRQAQGASRAARARNASGYPDTPNPTMMPAATGDTYERCRNDSRRCTLEMCSSITRAPDPRMASCSATLVWVYPAAFSTAPTASPAD